MLKDHIEKIENILKINKNFNNFCFSHVLDKKNLNIEIKDLLLKLLNKKYIKDYYDLNFYSNIDYLKDKTFYAARFSISYGYDLDLLRINISTNHSSKNIEVEKKIFLESNNKFSIKTNNIDILKLKNRLYDISDLIEKEMKDVLFNQDNDNNIKLLSLKNEYYMKTKEINEIIFFNKINKDKIQELLKNFTNINLNDYEFKLYFSKDILKDNILVFSLYLSPFDILRNNSICLFSLEYNIEKDSYKIDNKLIKNSNLLKSSIDISKNINKFNKYFLNIFKG